MPLNSDRILSDIAALNVIDDERTRRYIAALDAKMASIIDRAAPALPSKHYLATGDPRSITEGAGYMAFFHAFRGSRFHRDARLRDSVREIIADVLAHQFDTGELAASGEAGVERPGVFPPHPHSSHGQSWYLEPLLLAMNWLKGEFTDAERARIDRAFFRTADFICTRPIYQVNNRAVIQCAINALCGRYFSEPRFLKEATRHFHAMPAQVFDPVSGQILEGSGPDGNYSGTTFEYLYFYRIMSGDVAIDRAMIAALKWLARVVDRSGLQMYCGATTRVPINNSGMLYDFLPALERYSAQEPYFQRMIDDYMDQYERSDALGGSGHSISPTIWALLEHQAVAAPAKAPDWYADVRGWYNRPEVGPEHYVYNEGYDHLYFPVRRGRTNTCIAARGRPALKDLQCWSYAKEPPVVYPVVDYPYDAATVRASKVVALGLDTAAQGVSGIQIPDFCWVDGETPGLILRFGPLWRFYVFTPRTTFVITDGDAGPFRVDWVVETALCGTPEIADGALRYPGRHGRLKFAGPAPELVDDGRARTFRFACEKSPAWFALTDETFTLHRAEPGTMVFSDQDGAYDVAYDIAPAKADPNDYGPFANRSQWRLRVERKLSHLQ